MTCPQGGHDPGIRSDHPLLELRRSEAAGPTVEQLNRFDSGRDLSGKIIDRHVSDRLGDPKAFAEIVRNYPGGKPRTEVTRIVGAEDRWVMTAGNTVMRIAGSGDFWWLEWRTVYPDDAVYLCVSLMQLLDGLVHRETVYWAPPFEAPEWRRPWVDVRLARDDPG